MPRETMLEYHEFDAPSTPLTLPKDNSITCRDPLKLDALLRFYADDSNDWSEPKPFVAMAELPPATSSPRRTSAHDKLLGNSARDIALQQQHHKGLDIDDQKTAQLQHSTQTAPLVRSPETSLGDNMVGPAILIEKPSFAVPSSHHSQGHEHPESSTGSHPPSHSGPKFPAMFTPTMPPEFLHEALQRPDQLHIETHESSPVFQGPEAVTFDHFRSSGRYDDDRGEDPSPRAVVALPRGFGEVRNPLERQSKISSIVSATSAPEQKSCCGSPFEQVPLGRGNMLLGGSSMDWTLPVPPQDDMTHFNNDVKHSAEHSQNNLAATSTVVSVHGDAVILHSRMLQFLRKLCQQNKRQEGGSGLVEIHRLKRLSHAAKLTPEQRSKFLPNSSQGKKLIPAEVCGKYFLRHANKNITDADAIIVALEGLSDAVINSQESVFSVIEERLSRIVSDNRAKFADNTFRFLWDSIHLVSIFAFFAISLDTNVLKLEFDSTSRRSWVLAVLLGVHLFWMLDVVYSSHVMAIDQSGRLVKDHWSIIRQRRTQLVIDLFCLFPLDFILEAGGAPFGVFLAFRSLKYVKMFRVSYLYELVNRDIITPGLVIFHFQVKKAVIGLAWLFLAVLSLAAIHNLIDIYSIEPAFGERKFPSLVHSVVAVSIILSGSNADFEVWVVGDKILYVLLAVCAMIGIGLVVGQLTSLVFSNSVSAENYQLMRDTLDIVEHYKVPKAIQREVLSFQMHALNDDVVRHMSNLQQLPLQMQQEILMYIKIDAVGRVKLFSGASQECHAALAVCLSRCIVEPEVEVIRFGDVGREMYMLAHGYADVILGNGKVVTTFTRGDCFGEMALVQHDAKRTATVRALTYCDLWTLNKDAFLEALVLYPELLRVVEVELIARKGNIEELRKSVEAVQQEMMKLDKEEEIVTPNSPDDPFKAFTTGPFDTGAGTSRREAKKGSSLFVATHRATIHLGSESPDLAEMPEEELDVHGGHAPATRWTAQRLTTFRQMSQAPSAPVVNNSFTKAPQLTTPNITAERSPMSLDEELQEALRAIESVKTFVDVQSVHAGSSFRARRSSVFS